MTKRSGCLALSGILLVAGLVLAVPAAEAAQLSDQNRFRASVRVSGGAGFALDGGGDLELTRLGIVRYFSDIASLPGYSVSQGWKKLSLVPDAEIDFVFNMTDRFQVGLGTGYIRANGKGDYSYDYREDGTASWGSYTYSDKVGYKRDYLLTAIPIRMTVFYTLPLGKLNVYAYGGGGFYLGSLKHEYSMDETFFYEDFSSVYLDEKYEVKATASGNEKSKHNALGFHGGLGLEMKLGRSIGLGLEVFGRFVNFGKWEGDLNEDDKTRTRSYLEGSGWYYDETQTEKYSESGALWYYEYLDPDFAKKYAYMQTFSEQPSGDGISGARGAKLNLNAIGVRLSLKIYFGIN